MKRYIQWQWSEAVGSYVIWGLSEKKDIGHLSVIKGRQKDLPRQKAVTD